MSTSTYSHPPPTSVLSVPSLSEQFLRTAAWLRPHQYPERNNRIPADCQDAQGKWLSAELAVLASDYFPSITLRPGEQWECTVRAHFIGWDERWDEEVDVAQQPYRLAPVGTAACCSTAWHPMWWHRAGERVMCWYATPRYPTAGDWLEGHIKRLDQHQAHIVMVTSHGRHITRWYRLDGDCVIPKHEWELAKNAWLAERGRKKAKEEGKRKEEDERLRAQRANVASAEILSYRQQMELQAAREREKQRRRSPGSASVPTSSSPTPTSTASPHSTSHSPTHSYTYTGPLPAALQQVEKSRSRSVISTSSSHFVVPPAVSPSSHRSRTAAPSISSPPASAAAPSSNTSVLIATLHAAATPASVTRSHSISSSSQSQASRISTSVSSTYVPPTVPHSSSSSSSSSSSFHPSSSVPMGASPPAATAPFFIGQFVEAKDMMEEWLPASISRIDAENNRVLVHFEGWASKYDEWISYLPPSPPSTPSSSSPSASSTSPSANSFPISARLRPLGSSLQPSNEEIQRAQTEKAFRHALTAAGFELIEQTGDGNCLFRCFAYLLYGSAEEHRRVREECMSYIESECEYYARFVSESIHEYVARGRRENEWGDHVEIEAMKELYEVNVLVLAAAHRPTSVPAAPAAEGAGAAVMLDVKGEELDGLRTVRLSYHGQSHYNCLLDGTDMAHILLTGRGGSGGGGRSLGEVRGVWRARRMAREKAAESQRSVAMTDERKEGEMRARMVEMTGAPLLESQRILLSPSVRLSH